MTITVKCNVRISSLFYCYLLSDSNRAEMTNKELN